MYLSVPHCFVPGETEGPAHTDITRKRETKANPPSIYRKSWNNLSIIGVHLKHNQAKFWALRNSIISKNISIKAVSLPILSSTIALATLYQSFYVPILSLHDPIFEKGEFCANYRFSALSRVKVHKIIVMRGSFRWYECLYVGVKMLRKKFLMCLFPFTDDHDLVKAACAQ